MFLGARRLERTSELVGNQENHPHGQVRFEPTDVPALLPLWLGAGLGSCLILVLVAIMLGYPLADRREDRGPHRPLPPAPRLQLAPARDLAQYRSAKSNELQHNRISVEAAMRATAQQGWGPPQ